MGISYGVCETMKGDEILSINCAPNRKRINCTPSWKNYVLRLWYILWYMIAFLSNAFIPS